MYLKRQGEESRHERNVEIKAEIQNIVPPRFCPKDIWSTVVTGEDIIENYVDRYNLKPLICN
jgi:hypothetical protein